MLLRRRACPACLHAQHAQHAQHAAASLSSRADASAREERSKRPPPDGRRRPQPRRWGLPAPAQPPPTWRHLARLLALLRRLLVSFLLRLLGGFLVLHLPKTAAAGHRGWAGGCGGGGLTRTHLPAHCLFTCSSAAATAGPGRPRSAPCTHPDRTERQRRLHQHRSDRQQGRLRRHEPRTRSTHLLRHRRRGPQLDGEGDELAVLLDQGLRCRLGRGQHRGVRSGSERQRGWAGAHRPSEWTCALQAPPLLLQARAVCKTLPI